MQIRYPAEKQQIQTTGKKDSSNQSYGIFQFLPVISTNLLFDLQKWKKNF